MANPIAVPGTNVPSGAAVSPGGAQGPTGVSANANNKATLGSDSLILVQGTATGVAATTHAQTVSGDDPQLTNARTPTAHHTTHEHGGSDAVSITYSDLLGLPATFAPTPHEASHVTGSDQIPSASASTKGLLNQVSGNTTDFIDGTNASQPLQPVIWSATRRVFNAIGNPTFEVDQRNVGTALTNPANAAFLLDRYQLMKGLPTGTVNVALQAVPTAPVLVPGTSFGITQSFLRFTVGTAQALAAGDYYGIRQAVEGPRWRELSSDVHSASILVRSSVAGLAFSLALGDQASAKSLCKLCTIPAANTWTLITLPNMPVWVAGGNWTSLPGSQGYYLYIFLAAGTTYLPPANNSWQNGYFLGAVGQSNFLATAGATFDIAFIQHEPGAFCTTPIDCPFTQNLDDSLRYFQKSYPYALAIGSGSSSFAMFNSLVVTSGVFTAYGALRFPKAMAKAPTATCWHNSTGAANAANGFYATTGTVPNASGSFSISSVPTTPTGIPYINSTGTSPSPIILIPEWTADTGW